VQNYSTACSVQEVGAPLCGRCNDRTSLEKNSKGNKEKNQGKCFTISMLNLITTVAICGAKNTSACKQNKKLI